MHKTVILDLGKVIVPFDFQRGYRALAEYSPLPVEELPGRIRATGLVVPFETGQIEAREFVERFTAALDARMSYEEFCRVWSSIFLPDPLIPEELVAGLRNRYRMVLLSNTNSIHFEMIRENYPILRHFDEYVVSYEVGALKPSPKIYDAAIRAARCEPGECFFADDIPEYVEGARRAGIDAVQFLNAGQLQADLEARGIRWV